MHPPENNRYPLPLDEQTRRRYLQATHDDDRTDPFASDPDQSICEMGQLALRAEKDKVDYYFALGDMCGQHIVGDDNRLQMFYVAKAMMAYQRAHDHAQNDVDRTMANRAIDVLGDWLNDFAYKHPTQRNLAVALWATADDDDDMPSPRVNRSSTSTILEKYRSGLANDPEETMFDAETDDRTRAQRINADVMSDVTQTRVNNNEHYASEAMERTTAYQLQDDTRGAQSMDIPLSEAAPLDVRETKRTVNVDQRTRPDKQKEQEFGVKDVIEGRYEVAEVKVGGMGVVYLCYDHEHREPVALKSFQRRFLDNERAVARFEKEAFTWIQLDKHPHIVQARLVRNINNRPHIILEHISGVEKMGADLRSWIDSQNLTLKQAMTFALHIALGMQHATTKVPGLVHRDLKPANIMVTHEGVAKITDFGLVRSVDLDKVPEAGDFETMVDASDNSYADDLRLTRMNAVVGTPPYMSPEQIRAQHNVDLRSDIYAYGLVLYEMLVGRHPFKARGVSEWRMAHLNSDVIFDDDVNVQLPHTLIDLILRCVDKVMDYRPTTWIEIVTELSAIFREEFDETPIVDFESTGLQAREIVNKGYSLTELGRYEDALKAYDEAIALEDDYAWAWGRKGRTLRLLERYDAALDCYDKALEIQPHDAWSWNGKGIILDRLGRLDDALYHFEQATTFDPNYVWYWYNRADVLKELGRYDEALTMINRALAIAPNHANSWGKLGQIYRYMGQPEQSLQPYRRALEIQPDYAWGHNGYGLSLKALGRLEEAAMSFKRAIHHQPDALWNWYNLSETLVDTERYYEALDPARECVRIDPTHAHSWGKLGQILRKLNRYAEALDAYDHAIELDPEFDWALNGKGLVLENLERYADALEAYRQAAAIKPNREWYWNNQGNALLLLGRYDEALQALEKAVDIHPDYSHSWALIAQTHRALGQYSAALEAAQTATRTDRSNARAWNEVGIINEQMGDFDAALKAYERAARYSPDKQAYLYKQADVLILLHRYREALDLLDEALTISNRNAYIWAKHAQALRKLNRLQEALTSYTKAVELDWDFGWAWNGHGLTLRSMGRIEESLESYREAIRSNPSIIWYYINLMSALLAIGRRKEALQVAEEAAEVDPDHPTVWARHGQVLRRLGRFEAALTSYDRAIQLDRHYAWAWNGKGMCLSSLGRIEEAAECYRNAVRFDDRDVWFWYNYGDTLFQLRQLREAKAAIEKALMVDPSHEQSHAKLSQIRRELDE